MNTSIRQVARIGMSPVELQLDETAHHALLSGVEKHSTRVKAAFGPSGLNSRTNVIKEFGLEDPFENIGAQLIREVAGKTNDIAGDGTTTATVLAESIYRQALENVTRGAD